MVVEMKYYCCLLTLNNYANVVAKNCAKVLNANATRSALYSTDEIPNLFFFGAAAAVDAEPPTEETTSRKK